MCPRKVSERTSEGPRRPKRARVGVISDTHGLVRPEALRALAGVDAIVHAGDIGPPAVLVALRSIAPLIAVRGNNDRDGWARSIPERAELEIAGIRIHVVHDVKELDLDPGEAGFAAVIAGHSHKPRSEVVDGVLFFNPGSAGPRRFKLPVSVGLLVVSGGKISAQHLLLKV